MAVERIPVKIAIINNGFLGMVRQWQNMFYDKRFSEVEFGFGVPDYVKLADAYGCIGLRVDGPDEVEAAIQKAQGVDDRPVVIDFRCDPEEMCFPMIPAGTSNSEILLGAETAEHKSDLLVHRTGSPGHVGSDFAYTGMRS